MTQHPTIVPWPQSTKSIISSLLLPLLGLILILSLSLTVSGAEAGLGKENGKTVYYQEDGTLLKNGSVQIGNYLYTFDANGYLKKKARVYKAKWILQDGKYYWRRTNGKILQRTGKVTLNGSVYFISKDHSRYSGFQTIKGKLYYFREKNGKRISVPGWKSIKGKKYYLTKKYTLAVGRTKIDGDYYYFNKKGALVTNKTYYKVDGKYYHINKKGVMRPVVDTDMGFSDGSDLDDDDDDSGYGRDDDEEDEDDYSYGGGGDGGLSGECYALAESFVRRYAPSGSAYDRFHTCFNVLLGQQTFVVRPASFYNFGSPGWAYRLAINYFESGLVGDCHCFACAVAAVGSVLGYSPTVVVTAQDHSYVVVNGRYLDNMGPQFFSTTDHSGYQTRYTAQF